MHNLKVVVVVVVKGSTGTQTRNANQRPTAASPSRSRGHLGDCLGQQETTPRGEPAGRQVKWRRTHTRTAIPQPGGHWNTQDRTSNSSNKQQTGTQSQRPRTLPTGKAADEAMAKLVAEIRASGLAASRNHTPRSHEGNTPRSQPSTTPRGGLNTRGSFSASSPRGQTGLFGRTSSSSPRGASPRVASSPRGASPRAQSPRHSSPRAEPVGGVPGE